MLFSVHKNTQKYTKIFIKTPFSVPSVFSVVKNSRRVC